MANSEPLIEVSEAVDIAWKVYELGWVHDHSSNQNFGELGNYVENLAQNLTNIVRVVENSRLLHQQHAVRSPNFRGYSSQKNWDLSAIHEIVGDFRSTLNECEMLITQHRVVVYGQHEQQSVYNKEWTQFVQPKVDDLQTRVRAHSSKAAVLLRPLETKLLLGIRHEFGGEPTQDRFGLALPVLPIQGLLVFDLEQAVAEYGRQQPIPLAIPAELESKLRMAVEQATPALRVPGGPFLQTGVDAFINYFEQSTKGFTAGNFVNERTPSPKQYISLLNCLIILGYLQESEELKHAGQESFWPVYIAELAEVLRLECQKFTTSSPQRLIAPDLTSLESELMPKDYGKWKEDEISNLMSPHVNTNMEEVFKVPLPSPQASLSRDLTISRVDQTKLQLVESVTSRDSPSNRLGQITLDIDLKTIRLTPIYATPSSRPRPLEVLLHTGASQLNPSFIEPKHVLRLQHLLTGYRVYDRYDQAMVKVSFFTAGQTTPLEEHGRIQLWLPQPFQPVNKVTPTTTAEPPPIPQAPAEPAPRPVTSSNRTGSIRKWIPGLRRNSGEANRLSRGVSNKSSSVSGSSSHSTSPSDSPNTSYTNPNYPPIMEIARNGRYQTAAPAQAGPFELPANFPAIPSPTIDFSGLCPVSPTMVSAPLGNDHPPYVSHKPSTQGTGVTGFGFNGGSPISPNSPDAHTSKKYTNFSSNYVSHNLQVPSSTRPSDPTPQTSHQHLPHTSDQRAHSTTHSTTRLSFPGSHAAPPYFPTRAPSTSYTPTLPTRSARITPSVMTSMSTRSHSSLAPTVSTIKTSRASPNSSGGIARLHHKPQKPLLVIFLKSRDAQARLAIVAVQIDSLTSVKRERCECYNSHSACRISCLEREKGGSLLAQRWDAEDGLADWNLAKLGEAQRREGENLWSNLRRVSIKFEKMEDRYRFAGSPCSCNVKTTHELSRCNLASHNGLFGIVKQIGEQMLRNYHNERDHASTRTMVLGSLPEGDL